MYLNKIFSSGVPKKEPTIWLIMFTPRQSFTLSSLFTWHRKNFDHCCALSYNAYYGCWFLVDWSGTGLWCEPMVKSEVDFLMAAALSNDWKVLKYHQREYDHMPLFGTFCVNAVKHLLGIKSWAITPYQLYKSLKKKGAVDVFD